MNKAGSKYFNNGTDKNIRGSSSSKVLLEFKPGKIILVGY